MYKLEIKRHYTEFDNEEHSHIVIISEQEAPCAKARRDEVAIIKRACRVLDIRVDIHAPCMTDEDHSEQFIAVSPGTRRETHVRFIISPYDGLG